MTAANRPNRPNRPFIAKDIESVQSMSSVPRILETVADITGLGFICIARVTQDSWTVCAVLDRLDFGLQVGGELDVKTTLCDEVRGSGKAIVIDNVSQDTRYRDHQTPRIYGFESYISVPIFRPGGDYFGTLCGLDPAPATLSAPATVSSLMLFAQLIASQLLSEADLSTARKELLDEKATAELREQFIAVLGHDIRNPLGAILNGANMLLLSNKLEPKLAAVAERVKRSTLRISTLVDDVVDFTRGKMGGGIALDLRHENGLQEMLQQVFDELQSSYTEREMLLAIDIRTPLFCDGARLAQMLSNLLKNALVHGDPDWPITVSAHNHGGIFVLCVSNGGAPIPPAKLQQLFQPYWRGEPSAANEGLGLGLFIVAEIARSHGGEIDVVSDHTGTHFKFVLKSPEFVERRSRSTPVGERPERRKGSAARFA